jgi:hypothetical protein
VHRLILLIGSDHTDRRAIPHEGLTMLSDIIGRGWENFLARPEGNLNFRFILQPSIAALIALRAGIKDAREHRPAYLWAVFTNPAHRSQLVHGGWKDMRTPFLIAVTLDAIYQTITHQAIYLLELLFTATLLALIPYVVLRGPVNRIAQLFIIGRTHAPLTTNKDVRQ